MEHSEDLFIGNKWYQFTAEDEATLNYYQLRVMPFARGMLDWHPYIQLFNMFYQDFQATVVEFDASFFAEVQLFWDYSTVALGTGTRDLCWGYGYYVELIDIDILINLWITQCYITIFDNLETPISVIKDPIIECSESTTQDVNLYVTDLYAADVAVYLLGAEPDPTTQGVSVATYCSLQIFGANNSIFNSVFDIGLDAVRTYGKAKPGMEKPAILQKKHKSRSIKSHK